MVEQGEAVATGHHDVGEDEVAAGVVLQMHHGVVGVGCGRDIVASLLQPGHDQGDDGRLVVDHEDVVGARCSSLLPGLR